MLSIVVFVFGLVGGYNLTSFILRRRAAHKRLVFAACAVINDFRERQRLYPAWYRQPHLLKVMNELDRSIAVKDFRGRVSAAAAMNELIDATKGVN